MCFLCVNIIYRKKSVVFMDNLDKEQTKNEISGEEYRLECLNKQAKCKQDIKNAERIIKEHENDPLYRSYITILRESIRSNAELANRLYAKYYLSLFDDCSHVWAKDTKVADGTEKYFCIKCNFQVAARDFGDKVAVSKLRKVCNQYLKLKNIITEEDRDKFIHERGKLTDLKGNSEVVIDIVKKIIKEDANISDDDLLAELNRRYQYLPRPRHYGKKFRF